MTLYVIDIAASSNADLSEPDAYYKMEGITLHRDFIRGYTTNRIKALTYYNFLVQILSKYVDVYIIESEIPDNTPELKILDIAKEIHNDYIRRHPGFYASTLSDIISHELDNGDYFCITRTLDEFLEIPETYNGVRKIFMNSLLFLYDDIFKYIKLKNDGRFSEFLEYIFDGIPDQYFILSEPQEVYNIDYDILKKMVMVKLKYIDL